MTSWTYDMNAIELKGELRDMIDWRVTFPDVMFRDRDYRYAYFFETPWTGRADIGAELDRLLVQRDTSNAVVSLEHENDGSFDETRAESSTWTIDEGELFSSRRVLKYLKSEPIWPGLTVASGESSEWVLYENPAEPFGVLVTKSSLVQLQPDRDIVFDVRRLLELAKRPTSNFHEWVPERIASSFGSMI